MERFVITGGYPIGGRIKPMGNKNSALPILAACLLSDEPVRLYNLPDIGDIRIMLALLESLGTTIQRLPSGAVTVQSNTLPSNELDPKLSQSIRASILLAGPLLARTGQVKLPAPGGDVIGRRRLDSHFLAFEALGAKVTHDTAYTITASHLTGNHIFLDEPSVTATENAIMAASLAKGITVIDNAACEPHVQDLANLLNRMGAKINGIGTNHLEIQGVSHLHSTEFTISPDHIEVGSFIGLAAVTQGALKIEGVIPDHMRTVLFGLSRLGIDTEFQDNHTLYVPPNQKLEIKSDWHNRIPRIDDGPWPAFPADMMSIAIVVATQAIGPVLFFEKMFESRMFFLDRLIDMGARLVLCDPHRAVVSGPCNLHSGEMASPDIRAGMALLIASLCAKGTSIIHNIHQIDRGYEQIDRKLASLGAKIIREIDTA